MYQVFGVENIHLNGSKISFLENHVLLANCCSYECAEEFIKNLPIKELDSYICVYIQERLV